MCDRWSPALKSDSAFAGPLVNAINGLVMSGLSIVGCACQGDYHGKLAIGKSQNTRRVAGAECYI